MKTVSAGDFLSINSIYSRFDTSCYFFVPVVILQDGFETSPDRKTAPETTQSKSLKILYVPVRHTENEKSCKFHRKDGLKSCLFEGSYDQ